LKTIAAIIAAAALCGCTTPLIQAPNEQVGTRDITLDINPTTAQCQAYQQAGPTGSYDPGRRVLTVPNSQSSLEILCSAPGFKDKRVVVEPGDNFLGPVGFLVSDFGPIDYFLSAYPGRVRIVMEPADQPGQPG
jgi:hypothetical protein